jgi:glycogen phosphorylase
MHWSWWALVLEPRDRRSVAALDAKLWRVKNNPWVVLQTAPRDRIERIPADSVFRRIVDGPVKASRQAAEAPARFRLNPAGSDLTWFAHLSMEFVLSGAPFKFV